MDHSIRNLMHCDAARIRLGGEPEEGKAMDGIGQQDAESAESREVFVVGCTAGAFSRKISNAATKQRIYGRLAQGESASLTRKRSEVQIF
jgi:hypothetical protein